MNKRKWIFSLLLFPQYYHQYLFRGRANIQDLLHHCLLHFEAPKTHRCPTMLLFHSKIAKINLITVQTPLICQVMKDSYLFYYFSDLHHFVHIFHCVGYNIQYYNWFFFLATYTNATFEQYFEISSSGFFFFSSQKWTMHVLAIKKLILGLGF